MAYTHALYGHRRDGLLWQTLGLVTVISAPEQSGALQPDVASEIYNGLLENYGRSKGPLTVDFRAMVPEAGASERATHLLHPYPAKLLRHIPALVLSTPQISPEGARVFDPFCGSGTTLVEAFIADRPAVGIDINPLAVLISKVKTTPIDDDVARREAKGVVRRAARIASAPVLNRPRLSYWYYDRILSDLARLREAIGEVTDATIRDALTVALSAVARDVSLANPRISVPVRLRPDAYPPDHFLHEKLTNRLEALQQINIPEVFAAIAGRMLERLSRLGGSDRNPAIIATVGDARHLGDAALSTRAPAEVDLIVTSPPYLSAQKYIRATSLNLLCLGIADTETISELQAQSIGREHFRKDQYQDSPAVSIPGAAELIAECRQRNPLRAHLAAVYLADMTAALGEAISRLRPGGAMVLVAGGNHLCDKEFDTPAYLRYLCEEQDLSLELQLTDTIRSRGLMTRRNQTASPIATERVMVFRK